MFFYTVHVREHVCVRYYIVCRSEWLYFHYIYRVDQLKQQKKEQVLQANIKSFVSLNVRL